MGWNWHLAGGSFYGEHFLSSPNPSTSRHAHVTCTSLYIYTIYSIYIDHDPNWLLIAFVLSSGSFVCAAGLSSYTTFMIAFLLYCVPTPLK